VIRKRGQSVKDQSRRYGGGRSRRAPPLPYIQHPPPPLNLKRTSPRTRRRRRQRSAPRASSHRLDLNWSHRRQVVAGAYIGVVVVCSASKKMPGSGTLVAGQQRAVDHHHRGMAECQTSPSCSRFRHGGLQAQKLGQPPALLSRRHRSLCRRRRRRSSSPLWGRVVEVHPYERGLVSSFSRIIAESSIRSLVGGNFPSSRSSTIQNQNSLSQLCIIGV
jgi:hypothetical protein